MQHDIFLLYSIHIEYQYYNIKIKLFVNFSQKVFYYTYVIRYYFEDILTGYPFIVDQNIIFCVYKKNIFT